MKYKINCYLKKIPSFLKDLNLKLNYPEEYIDIKNFYDLDNNKILYCMIQCSTKKLNLSALTKYIELKKEFNIWIDKNGKLQKLSKNKILKKQKINFI